MSNETRRDIGRGWAIFSAIWDGAKRRVVSIGWARRGWTVKQFIAVLEALPPDARVMDMRTDILSDRVQLVIGSKKFPIVEEGCICPEVRVMFRESAGMITAELEFPWVRNG
jgi:hypothetical protein